MLLNDKRRNVIKTRLNIQKGIGLIEVLVTTVVVSLGLLSIASMQGNFLSESGENKARAEAQIFAEQKIEEFRNTATEVQYANLASGTDTKTGQNAEFSRAWTVVDLTTPDRKSIVVTVTWTTGTITLSSELAWNMVGNAAIYSSTGGGAGMATSLPSPSSDAAIVEAMDPIPVSATADGYGFKVYRNSDGKQVVADPEYDSGNGRQLTCGHVCLSIKGRVLLPNLTDFNTYDIRGDDRTVCSWEEDVDGNPIDIEDTDVGASSDTFHTRNYICYFGGDCGSETSATYAAAGCPSDYATLPAINVRGGWRGNIGIVGFSSPTTRTLCYVGQVAGVTPRNYETTRLESGSETQEGVNSNFECHDFLMIDKASSSCESYILTTSSSYVNRELEGDKIDPVSDGVESRVNRVQTNTENCSVASVFTFTGDITGTNSQRAAVIVSAGGVSCETGDKTGSPSSRYLSYTCAVPGSAGDIVTLEVSSSDGTPIVSGSGSVTLAEPVTSVPNISF